MHSQDTIILSAVLDTLNFAIFVLNEDRKPLHANTKALALVEKGRPFHLDQAGSLRIVEAVDDKALRESVGALHRRRGGTEKRIVPVHAGGASPAMFAWLSILPPGGQTCMAGSPQISVMVTERSFNAVGREVLADLFGLTQAESRLVQALVQGVSPSQYAARQKLSQNTIRNQLKSIFEKTEVRRQSDLVSLICNVLVPVNFENAPN